MPKPTKDPNETFERWYVIPLRILETLPNGDGAFVVFAVSLALYERFAKAFIKERLKLKANSNELCRKLAADFDLRESAATTFWDVMRNGLQHQGMPLVAKSSIRRWRFSGKCTKPIEFRAGDTELWVQPWLFRDKVLWLYRQDPELIATSESFPWASIFPDPA